MKNITKKGIALTMLLLTVNLYVLENPLVWAGTITAAKATITEHEPQGETTPEIDAPEKGSSKWLWIIAGAVAVIGLAAAAAGGGGGGGSSSSSGGESATGSFEVSW